MTFNIATTVDDTYRACNPDEPLQSNDERYVDLSDVRGKSNKIINTIHRSITRSADKYSKFLVSGHRGCGKSTELLRLKDNLTDDNYFCVYFDVGDALDLGDVQYIEVFISMVHAIARELEKQNITIKGDSVETITHWFQQTIVQETETKTSSQAKVEASVQAKSGVPVLLSLLVNCIAEFRLNHHKRETIRTEITRNSQSFILQINQFLIAVNNALNTNATAKKLVVIADGLEKIQYRNYKDGNNSHTEMFVKHADQLKSLHCHIIYTMPITLAYTDNIGSDFDKLLILPMVKLDKDETEGIAKFKEILNKRIATTTVFANPNDLNRLIDISGGVLRDLMRLVRMATDTDDEKISSNQVTIAISDLSKEYDRLIKSSDITILKNIYTSKRLSLDAERISELLLNRVILEYENGSRSADVHSAVMNIDWIKKAIDIDSTE